MAFESWPPTRCDEQADGSKAYGEGPLAGAPQLGGSHTSDDLDSAPVAWR